MNVLVVGATGPLGRLIVRDSLEHGDAVTAVVRSSQQPTALPKAIKTVRGDVLRLESLAAAMEGQDAVISSLGSKVSFKPVTMLSEGTMNLLKAMKSAGVQRFVCITGIGAGDSKGHGGLLYDWIIQPLVLREVYKDKTRQEEVIRRSEIDWTIVRPAQLTNGPPSREEDVRAITDLNGVTAKSISRADVAKFAVLIARTRSYLREAVLLTR